MIGTLQNKVRRTRGGPAAIAAAACFCLSMAVSASDSLGTAPVLMSPSDSLSLMNSLIEKETGNAAYYGQLIIKEREQLIQDIQTLRRIFPLSQHNGEIMLRLAELYYEKETEEFDKRLDAYNRQIEAADARGDTAGIPFPELTYDKTIAVYDELIRTPFHADAHPAAMYYKALCLVKLKKEDEAVALITELTHKYPESDFYVAGLIKIGDYHFNRPFIKGGQGYNLALESFKKAVSYPSSPYFSEAMYKLGWCYFQQDKYKDAILVFQSLIEHSNLDFNSTGGISAIANPLLREEAIEFLAVSLDESGDLDETLDFLRIIGSDDYATRVLVKLSNIHVSRSDFEKSNEVLGLLLTNYSLGLMAPAAKLAMVKNLQSMDKKEEADRHLLEFFDGFGKGSEWYRNNRDPEMRAYVDSQAIKILVRTAEEMLATAKKTNDRGLFIQVAKSYNQLIEQYPERRETYDVEWNLALILDKYIDNPASAYYNYMRVATAYPYTKYRKEALLSAVAAMQRVWESGQASVPADTALSGLALDTNLTSIEKDIVAAAHKFLEYFETEPEAEDIKTLEASIYFNRRRFAQAAPVYLELLGSVPRPRNYQEITRLLAQSYMGSGEFGEAEKYFGLLAAEAVNPDYTRAGKDGQVEAAFRNAEKLEKTGRLEEAAEAYIAVGRKYPSSSLADVAQFTAAEAYEKAGKFKAASSAYIDLSRTFPLSKYADGALFNAAGNLESAKEYKEAIALYEDLISRFPGSPHLKNALFNISLNYEKLQDFENVARTNERYASLFPEEKDAPDMLFSTGKFYMKAGQYEKAMAIFRRFYTKYLGSERELEARVMSGKCYLEMGEERQAQESFENAISRTALLISQGVEVSSFHASEAQFGLAEIFSRRYYEVRLMLPEDVLAISKKRKAELLKEAVAAYQKVLEYKNENAIKSTYRIGSLYEDFAFAWKSQELPPGLSPEKRAVQERKTFSAASKFLQQSKPYFEKAVELRVSASQAGLSAEVLSYLDSAQLKLKSLDLTAVQWEIHSAYVIMESPVPENIRQKPLTYFLYTGKLLETTLKDFETSVGSLQALWQKIPEKERSSAYAESVRLLYAKENFLLGARFFTQADMMLSYTTEHADSLDEDTREELQFQLEDMAFEAQDKAVPLLSASLERVKQDKLQDIWSRQVSEILRKLDPQSNPLPARMQKIVITGGPQWWAGTQDFEGWNTDLSESFTSQVFGPVAVSSLSEKVDFAGAKVTPMWSAQPADSLIFRRLFPIKGGIQSAIIDITAEESFTLYLNGRELFKETEQKGDFRNLKTFNVGSLIQQGDNLIAVKARSTSAGRGLVFRMEILIDTTGAAAAPQATGEAATEQPAFTFQRRNMDELKSAYKNRQEYRDELLKYQKQARDLSRDARSEQNKVRFLREQLGNVHSDLKALDLELEQYKRQLEDLKR